MTHISINRKKPSVMERLKYQLIVCLDYIVVVSGVDQISSVMSDTTYWVAN